MRFTKALCLGLLLLLAPVPASAAFPDVALVDNCSRANEGPPPSASWVNSLAQGFKVLSNVCVSNSAGDVASSTWNTSFGPDMEVAVTIAQAQQDGSYWALSLRQQTNTDFESDHYEIGFERVAGAGNDVMYVFQVVGGVFTQLGATINLGADFTAGDKMGARIVSDTITVFRNGSSITTRTDSGITGAGYAGISADPAATPVHVSEFYAGNWPVVASGAKFRTLLGVGQ